MGFFPAQILAGVIILSVLWFTDTVQEMFPAESTGAFILQRIIIGLGATFSGYLIMSGLRGEVFQQGVRKHLNPNIFVVGLGVALVAIAWFTSFPASLVEEQEVELIFGNEELNLDGVMNRIMTSLFSMVGVLLVFKGSFNVRTWEESVQRRKQRRQERYAREERAYAADSEYE